MSSGYGDLFYKKLKYFQKVLSQDAVTVNWQRSLDVANLFADYVWLNIPLFDLSQLGLGLIFSILPYEFQPFAIDFTYSFPTTDEMMQGIWADFNKVYYELEYPWTSNTTQFVQTNFKPELWKGIQQSMTKKAKYGEAKFYGFVYDPVLQREYTTSTFHKLRLIRTPDLSWKVTNEQLAENVQIDKIVTREVEARLNLLASAQVNSFCLGLSVLGKSKLNSKPAVIPYVTPEGKLLEVKYWTLDQLMFGFILGVSELGYGVLLPKYSTFELPEGKNNPEVIKLIVNKVTGAINRLSLLPWVYGQYNKPEEMADIHKSERTSQYDLLQAQRRFIEDWVRNRLAKYRLDNMRIRQYQNAVLQAVGWKSKRHPWGFKPFKDTSEDQFKAFWINNWKSQGLDENILRELYDSLESIIQAIRDIKTSIGEKVGQTRRMLAGSV
jgi:hypothetical protein